jgi:hypothetical protein
VGYPVLSRIKDSWLFKLGFFFLKSSREGDEGNRWSRQSQAFRKEDEYENSTGFKDEISSIMQDKSLLLMSNYKDCEMWRKS